MRAILQRSERASVTVDDKVVGSIDHGLLVLLGVRRGDRKKDADFIARKVLQLRIFADEEGKMNRSITDVEGGILVVSQFTLYGNTRKGNRPSFTRSAAPDDAQRLYDYFVSRLRESGLNVESGRFQAMMKVELVNEGPVTLIVESPAQQAD